MSPPPHIDVIFQPKNKSLTLSRTVDMGGLEFFVGSRQSRRRTLYDHGCGAILADEMGLGKTLQACASPPPP